jgi:excisionase family DNA binding protein
MPSTGSRGSRLTVAQAADAAGLSRSRIDALIRAGKISATKVGHQWVLDEPQQLAALTHRRGRPLSPRMAWAFMLDLDGVDVPWITAVERRRLRDHRDRLRHDPDPVTRWQALAAGRARRITYVGTDPVALLDDAEVQASGLSDPRSGLSAGSEAEAYVHEDDWPRIVRRHLLVEPTGRPDVWLHVCAYLPPRALRLQVAADLADHGGPRERARASAIVDEVLGTRESR